MRALGFTLLLLTSACYVGRHDPRTDRPIGKGAGPVSESATTAASHHVEPLGLAAALRREDRLRGDLPLDAPRPAAPMAIGGGPPATD
jgi:hypothetical protein